MVVLRNSFAAPGPVDNDYAEKLRKACEMGFYKVIYAVES